MSRLREPGLGPLVGHTTDSACRLWIRAGDPEDSGAKLAPQRRTVGVITVVKAGGKKAADAPVYYFRLQREYDRTGTFMLGEDISLRGVGEAFEMRPDTEYVVRMGTLTLDDPLSDDESLESEELVGRLPSPDVWRQELVERLPAKQSEATFRTFPRADKVAENISFVIGSCRYPGLLWRVKHADRIFAPIGRLVMNPTDDEPAPNFVLMVGDQIYADMFSRLIPVGLADTFEEFQDRYHKAYGSPNMRKLLQRVPTYMILDDHEIEDNWTQDRFDNGSKRFLFNIAINAYMSYQWVHSPRNFGTRLHYSFDCGGYPFFVMDTRTQRYMDDNEDTLEDNHMLGRPALDDAPNQLNRLLDWLVRMQDERDNVPKFIVSSSVFVPNPVKARADSSKKRKEASDSWPGFPTTRRVILDCIVENNIQNVIFASGDIHCSNLASMHFSGTAKAKKLKAFSITSSALYWPFPFADGDPSNYVHDSTTAEQEDPFLLTSGVTMHYKAWNFTQQDNFCRVDIDKAKATLSVRALDTWGDPIKEEIRSGGSRVIADTLHLARW